MKNTLDFYSKIYEPLFKKNYAKSEDRGRIAISRFEKFINKENVEIKNMIDVGCG